MRIRRGARGAAAGRGIVHGPWSRDPRTVALGLAATAVIVVLVVAADRLYGALAALPEGSPGARAATVLRGVAGAALVALIAHGFLGVIRGRGPGDSPPIE